MKRSSWGRPGAGARRSGDPRRRLCAAPAALAKTTTSSNWAGYAVHRPGVSYRQVSGTWTQPNATCISRPVDLFGGVGRSRRLQADLERARADRHRGRLQPGGEHGLERLVRARPGPVERRSRSWSARRRAARRRSPSSVISATLELDNLTLHRTFRKRLFAPSIDVELGRVDRRGAVRVHQPVRLPGAAAREFRVGRVRLGDRHVRRPGTTGSIADRAGGGRKIKLMPGAQRFIVGPQHERHRRHGDAVDAPGRGQPVRRDLRDRGRPATTSSPATLQTPAARSVRRALTPAHRRRSYSEALSGPYAVLPAAARCCEP